VIMDRWRHGVGQKSAPPSRVTRLGTERRTSHRTGPGTDAVIHERRESPLGRPSHGEAGLEGPLTGCSIRVSRQPVGGVAPWKHKR
jgi:hypothetical protein